MHPFFRSRLLCVVVVCVPQDVRRLCEALHKPHKGNWRQRAKNPKCTQRDGTINDGKKRCARGKQATESRDSTTTRGSLATTTTTIRLHSNYLHMLPGNVPACLVCVSVCVRMPAACVRLCACACVCVSLLALLSQVNALLLLLSSLPEWVFLCRYTISQLVRDQFSFAILILFSACLVVAVAVVLAVHSLRAGTRSIF